MSEPLQGADDLGDGYMAHRQSASAEDVIARARARVRAAQAPAEAAPAEGAPAAERKAEAAPAGESKGTAGTIARDIGRGLVEMPRQAIGGVSDAVHNAFMAADSLANWLNENVADLTFAVPLTGIEPIDALISNPAKAIAGEKHAVDPAQSVTGGLVRETARFLTGFLPAFKGARAIGAGTVAAGAAAGAVSDALTQDPREQNLSNLIQQFPALKNPVTEFLSADPNDNEALARFKKAAEGLGLGALADGLLFAMRTVNAARRAGKSTGQVIDELAAARAKYGEVGDRDFLILGDPSGPLVRLSKNSETDAAAAARRKGKIDAAEEAAAQGPVAPELLARIRELLNFKPRTLEDIGKEDVAQAMGEGAGLVPMLDRLRKGGMVEPKGTGLTEFVIKGGGIIDEGGDIRVIIGRAKDRPALINQNGQRLDDVALKAWEAGYLPEFSERPTAQEFLDVLRGDYDRTSRRFGQTIDDEARTHFEAERNLERVLDELGLDVHKLSNEDILLRLRSAVDDTTPRGLADLEKETADLTAAGLTRAGEVGDKGVFINFGRIQGADDVKELMQEMTRVFRKDVDAARRGVQSNEETKRLADELGLSVPDLLNRRKGQPFNAEEAVAARQLWAASAEKLMAIAKRAADPNAGALDQFMFRKMMATHYAIQAEVIGARTETARALQAWSIPAGGGVEKARAVQMMLDQMGGPSFSRAMAQRLALLERAGATPDAINTMVRKTWAASSMAVVQEAWVNALLSSPKTHIVNTTSNVGVMFQQIFERGAAARLAEATGGEVAPGEAIAMTFGVINATRDAFRAAAKAVRTGETGAALGKVDLPREHAITGDSLRESGHNGLAAAVDFIGEATRVPTRLLGAEDEFFKTIGYRMEVYAQALRQAHAEGHRGTTLGYRMAELINNPPEHIRLAAADAALYNTFTNATGGLGAALINLREKVPATVFVLPFVRTPVNIARYAFERSPLAPLVGQWRDDIAAGGARAELALARMGTGTAMMLTAADYADMGLISGSGPDDPGEREALQRQGWQPYSIRAGERWLSYNRLDPLGMTMGFAADLAWLVKRADIEPEELDEVNEVVAAAIAAVSRTVISKSYLQGFADFVEMMADPERYAPDYINKFAGSFVPAGAAAIESVVDPVTRETMSIGDAVKARIVGLSQSLPPKRDLWGAPAEPDSGFGAAWDALSPVQVRRAKDSPIDAEMQRLNLDVRRIKKRTNWEGADVNLRDWPEVYDAYVRLAGNDLKHPAWNLGAKDFLDAVVAGKHEMSDAYKLMSDGEDGGKGVFIKKTIAEYRQLARRAIVEDPKFADFAKAIDAKAQEKRNKRLPIGVEAPALQ